MKTLNIKALNTTLTNCTENQIKVNTLRATTVQAVIDSTLEFSKDNKDTFANKKQAMKYYVSVVGEDVDAYTKRALRVANAILIDGYKFKRELITLNQIEKLMSFDKSIVNGLMSYEGEDYITVCKDLIKSAYVAKESKTFSARTAKTIKKA